MYGSSSFLSDTYFFVPYCAYGPNRPTATLIGWPSGIVPSVRGSWNSSSACSSVRSSMRWPGLRLANFGFSTSSRVPIWANAPYLP